MLIFDGEISPLQARNLEQATGLRVIDRTMLILSIFERRAHTRDGKRRVALARLEYMRPHLLVNLFTDQDSDILRHFFTRRRGDLGRVFAVGFNAGSGVGRCVAAST